MLTKENRIKQFRHCHSLNSATESWRKCKMERPTESWEKRKMDRPIDRLSALPDSLLIHILSFLDVKAAAITYVLSKKWRSLWADSSKLKFREIPNSKLALRRGEFVAWVHRTLNIRTSKLLDKFELYFTYDISFASDVNAWVEFFVNNKAKNVHLMFLQWMRKDKYILPQVMYSSSSLTCLKLGTCIMSPERAIDWGSLTKLHLKLVQLSPELFENILSGCPVLSDFILEKCGGLYHFEVHSRSLDALEIITSPRNWRNMEISAPYIRSLKVATEKRLRLTNISSLVSVNLSLTCSPNALLDIEQRMRYEYDTIELFGSIQHVEKLELGCFYTKMLTALVAEGWRLPQSRREHLTVNVCSDDQIISLIVQLVKSSPNLETLIIKRGPPGSSCSTPLSGGRFESCLKTSDLNCDLLHLKMVTVDITGFTGTNIVTQPILTLVQILLKRAVVLEKMSIDVSELDNTVVFEKMSTDVSELDNTQIHAPGDYSNVAQTLLSYPKSSTKASVVVNS